MSVSARKILRCSMGFALGVFGHRDTVSGRGSAPKKERGSPKKIKNVSIPLGRRLVALDGATLKRVWLMPLVAWPLFAVRREPPNLFPSASPGWQRRAFSKRLRAALVGHKRRVFMRSKGFPGSAPALAMIGFGALMGAFVPGSVRAVPGAQTYYVSPSGNDAANGSTKKTAWRTLSRVAQQRFIAGDRLLLEGGVVHQGSIALDPSNSAGNFEIGSYGSGRAIIEAGNHSGIVIKNLNGIKISSLVIRGNGGTTDNDDILAQKNGILIISQADAPPAETIRYSDFRIYHVEVSKFEGTGLEIYGFSVTALRKARVSNVVVHDNAREGITVGADDIWSRPNEDIYIGHSLAYHNHGTPGLWHHTGSGIVIAGVTRGMIEYCEQYENGDLSDASYTGGPVGIWAWDSDQVTIQFCKSHHMGTRNWDGGGYDFDIITSNSVMQYNVSWENQGYGYQLYEGGWGLHSGNTVR